MSPFRVLVNLASQRNYSLTSSPQALRMIHEGGILHNDIRLQNIIVEEASGQVSKPCPSFPFAP